MSVCPPNRVLTSIRMANAVTLTLTCFLVWLLAIANQLFALDPNKHVTQYIHTSWRIQDGSAPAGMLSITQTADGFLWFSALAQGVYRFDGVRFDRPFSNTNLGSVHVGNIFSDRASGFWVIGDGQVAHFKNGVAMAHFELEGVGGRAGTTR